MKKPLPRNIVARNRKIQELYAQYREEGMNQGDAIARILELPEFVYSWLTPDGIRCHILYKQWTRVE